VKYIQNQNSQDLCSTVTVNKHTIKDQKVTAVLEMFYFWQWLIKYSVVLILTSLT